MVYAGLRNVTAFRGNGGRKRKISSVWSNEKLECTQGKKYGGECRVWREGSGFTSLHHPVNKKQW